MVEKLYYIKDMQFITRKKFVSHFACGFRYSTLCPVQFPDEEYLLYVKFGSMDTIIHLLTIQKREPNVYY